MPSVETILDKGFSNGQPWDSNPWRRAILLWVCPVCALVIALAGGFTIYDRMTAGYPVGYVVSNDDDCTLVVADRPGGPPVETVEQAQGGRLGTCGGLDADQRVYYDPDRGIQVFSPRDTQVGLFAIPVFALLAGVPGVLAWVNTLQKRRTGSRPAPTRT